jgi:hypothetical protein
MFRRLQRIQDFIDARTSDLLERIERIEAAQAALRARVEGERQLRFLAREIGKAADLAPIIGDAVEKLAQALRSPLPRGRAGGLARARTAWRHFDGTFLLEAAKAEVYLAERERYAVGGGHGSQTRSASMMVPLPPIAFTTSFSWIPYNGLLGRLEESRAAAIVTQFP